MEVAPVPDDEGERMAQLASLGLLDSEPDERFDRITRLACRLFDAPMGAIQLVDADRVWTLSAHGTSRGSEPRPLSLSAHAILGVSPLVITDRLRDTRFGIGRSGIDARPPEGPLAPRFYAGAPLRLLPSGSALGVLCLMDSWPRAFAPVDEGVLRDLADLVERELRIVHGSVSDGDTGLAKPQAFVELGQKALMICARSRAPAALLRFELEADAVAEEPELPARAFSRLLRASFRSSDVLGRLAPDTFAALVTHCSEPYLRVVVERVQRAVAEHNQGVSRQRGPGPALHFRVAVRALMPSAHTSMAELLQQGPAWPRAPEKPVEADALNAS
jgi:hypothetical protein